LKIDGIYDGLFLIQKQKDLYSHIVRLSLWLPSSPTIKGEVTQCHLNLIFSTKIFGEDAMLLHTFVKICDGLFNSIK